MGDIDDLIRALKKLRYYIIAVLAIPSIGVMIYIGRIERGHKIEMAQLVQHVTYQKTYALANIGVQERYNRYLDMCIRIWNVYGYTYRKPSDRYPVPKAMSDEERVEVWELNFKLAEGFGFADQKNGTGYYDPFAKGSMESALDPNARGAFGEYTWLQMKKMAVHHALGIYNYELPDRYKRLIGKMEWTGNMEDIDSVTALKMAYCLMWYYRKEYRGIETWYVSMYHWGDGFLGKHFRNGYGKFPTKFVINGISYKPILYYIRFRELKEAWETGDIEGGKEVVIKWNRYKTAVIKEERQLLDTHKTIRGLSKKIAAVEKNMAEKERLVEESKGMIVDLKKAIDNQEIEFRKIYGNIKGWQEGNLRVYMATAGKDIAKQFLKEVTDNRAGNMKFILLAGVVVLMMLALAVFCIMCTIRYIATKVKEAKS